MFQCQCGFGAESAALRVLGALLEAPECLGIGLLCHRGRVTVFTDALNHDGVRPTAICRYVWSPSVCVVSGLKGEPDAGVQPFIGFAMQPIVELDGTAQRQHDLSDNGPPHVADDPGCGGCGAAVPPHHQVVLAAPHFQRWLRAIGAI